MPRQSRRGASRLLGFPARPKPQAPLLRLENDAVEIAAGIVGKWHLATPRAVFPSTRASTSGWASRTLQMNRSGPTTRSSIPTPSPGRIHHAGPQGRTGREPASGPARLPPRKQKKSNRDGFVVYVGNDVHGVKWRNWKMMSKELDIGDGPVKISRFLGLQPPARSQGGDRRPRMCPEPLGALPGGQDPHRPHRFPQERAAHPAGNDRPLHSETMSPRARREGDGTEWSAASVRKRHWAVVASSMLLPARSTLILNVVPGARPASRLRLGFAGLITEGAHHPPHHLAMVKGEARPSHSLSRPGTAASTPCRGGASVGKRLRRSALTHRSCPTQPALCGYADFRPAATPLMYSRKRGVGSNPSTSAALATKLDVALMS